MNYSLHSSTRSFSPTRSTLYGRSPPKCILGREHEIWQCPASNANNFMIGYEGQKAIMIDEMSGSTMPFNLFKTIIHQGVVIANIKNDSVPVAARFIGVCSNYWLEHWWTAKKRQTADEPEEGSINYHAIWRVIDELRIYHAFRRKPKRGDPWCTTDNNVVIKRNDDVDGDGAMIREQALTVYIDKLEGFYNRARYVPPPEKPIVPPRSTQTLTKKSGSASGTTTTRPDGTN